ncbi:hypothetical protein BASA81_005500 [Batrachochytrium salamandrivorans]|nr:hypothetical protein BASA81_005500 [Batrachochytrium salamandrivorans]
MKHGLQWLGGLALLLLLSSLRHYDMAAVVPTTSSLRSTIPPSLQAYVNKVQRANTYLECATARNGSWVPMAPGTTLPRWNCTSAPEACPNIDHSITAKEVKHRGLFYMWKPPASADCNDLASFTRARFCQVLNGRMLYLMGDSTMEEFYGNLRYLFEEHMTSPTRMRRITLTCPKPFPNFILDLNRANHLLTKVENAMGVTNHTVFVANKGAHFVTTPQLLTDVRLVMHDLFRDYSSATIVWRSTAAGLGDYPNVHLPLLVPPPFINLTFPLALNHSWHQVEEQNLAVKTVLNNEYPTVLYMDVFPMDALRVDGRRNGINFCVPSQRMEWVTLLMNLLIQVDK